MVGLNYRCQPGFQSSLWQKSRILQKVNGGGGPSASRSSRSVEERASRKAGSKAVCRRAATAPGNYYNEWLVLKRDNSIERLNGRQLNRYR